MAAPSSPRAAAAAEQLRESRSSRRQSNSGILSEEALFLHSQSVPSLGMLSMASDGHDHRRRRGSSLRGGKDRVAAGSSSIGEGANAASGAVGDIEARVVFPAVLQRQ